MRKTYVLDPVTRELVEKKDFHKAHGAYIIGDIEPIISPIDGSIIGSRSKYREHNEKHGVVPYEEFGDKWFEKKAKERIENLNLSSSRERKERIEALKYAFDKHRR